MNITLIVSLTSANSVRRRFTFKVIRDKFKLSVVRLTPRFSNQSDNVGYCAFASQVIRFTRIFNNIAGVRVRIIFLFVSLGFDPCKLIKTSGVTTAPATPAMQGGGTLGGRHITKLTVC